MLTLTTLLLAAQAVASSGVTPNVCSTSVVAPGQRPGRGTPSFSVTDTMNVELWTRVRPAVTGDHILRLKLHTPRGYLYQTLTIPIHVVDPASDEAPDERPATRVVPGFPRPLEVQTLGASGSDAGSGPRRRVVSRDQATARLPVAGTSISLGSLFGKWTVVPYLDDGTAPCGPRLVFEVRE
jgi:hypothetical protein